MNKSQIITGVGVAVLALSGALPAFAQFKKSSPSPTPNASGSPAAAAAEKAPRAIPFRGTVASVDSRAKTFTIAGKEKSRTFKVTDRSVVTKAGAAATMADIVANEQVRGSYWKGADGSLEAKTVKVGPKTDAEQAASGKKSKKKSDAAAADGSSPAASPSPSPKK